jgi:hypothetical protein
MEKMMPVKAIPRIGRRERKENDGGSGFNYDIFDIL